MQLVRSSIICTGTGFTASWHTNQPATATIQYGPKGGEITEVVVGSATYTHTSSIAGLTTGIHYRARIVASSSVTEDVAITYWTEFQAFTTGTTATTQAAVPLDVIPYDTSVGTILAENLPEWSAMGQGDIPPTTATASSGSPYLRFSTMAALDGWKLGHLVKPAVLRYCQYQVAANPGTITFEAASSGSTLTISSWPSCLLDGDDPLVLTAEDGTTATAETIDSVGGTITLDASVARTTTQGWSCALPVITLDQNVSASDADYTSWTATTLGRRMTEAIGRAITQVSHAIDDASYPWTIVRQPSEQAWRGHIFALPSWDPTQSPESIIVSKVTGSLPSPGDTAPTLCPVQSPADLISLPIPCYLIVNQVVLLHNLTLIEEAVTLTAGVGSLDWAVVPGTTLWINTTPNYTTGWQAYGPDLYTTAPDGDGTTLTLLSVPLETALLVRYQAAVSNSNLYGSTTQVICQGRTITPVSHLLWNHLDDLGSILGTPRLWSATYQESNDDYKVRLTAAASIDPAGWRDTALTHTALELGFLTATSWRPIDNPTLELADGTTVVTIPGYPENQTRNSVVLSRGPEDGNYRYYAIEPVLGDTTLWINGQLDPRNLQTEQEETVTVTLPASSITFTLTEVPAPNVALLIRTRDRDWFPLWPDEYTVATSTVSWDAGEDNAALLLVSPFDVRYTSTIGSGTDTLPPMFVTLTEAEWRTDPVVAASYLCPNWRYDETLHTLYSLSLPQQELVTVYSVEDATLKSLYATDGTLLYDLDNGLPTAEATLIQQELNHRIPIVVGYGACWDTTDWYDRDNPAPVIKHLSTPWGATL